MRCAGHPIPRPCRRRRRVSHVKTAVRAVGPLPCRCDNRGGTNPLSHQSQDAYSRCETGHGDRREHPLKAPSARSARAIGSRRSSGPSPSSTPSRWRPRAGRDRARREGRPAQVNRPPLHGEPRRRRPGRAQPAHRPLPPRAAHLRARRSGDAADEPLGRGAAVPGGPGARYRRDRPPGRARRGRGDLHRAGRGAPGPARALGHRPRLPGPRDEPRQGAAGGPAAPSASPRSSPSAAWPPSRPTRSPTRPSSPRNSSASANAATRSTTRSTTRACAASGRACATTAATSSPPWGSGDRSPASPRPASKSSPSLVMAAARGLSRRLGAHQSGAYTPGRTARAHHGLRDAGPPAGASMSSRPPPG